MSSLSIKEDFKEQLLISLDDFDEHIFQFLYDAFFHRYNLKYWELVQLVFESLLELHSQKKIIAVEQNINHSDNTINVEGERHLNRAEFLLHLNKPSNWDRSVVLNQTQWVVIRNAENESI